MPIAPVRNIGRYGVIYDQDPFDIPVCAFTMSSNARFENNKITRGPVFGLVGDLSTLSPPKFSISYLSPQGIPTYQIAKQDGNVYSFVPGGGGTSLSPSGYTGSNFDQSYTSCIVNDVVYLNRPDRVPWFMLREGSQYANLTNWDSTWRCQAMRAFNGQIIAINVTKGGVAYPSMIAWSDFTVWQSVPGSWSAATTNSAGSNVLADLGDPLVDGLALRSTFVLYSSNETWSMTATGDASVFSFARMFNGWGTISQNCVVEVNNVHYVLGNDRIWRHDGYTPQDISVGRVRDFIYKNMDKANAWQFFVVSKPRDNEIHFCYRSIDSYCAFPINGVNDYHGCNKAAVYNYKADTWYFYDMPYVTSAGYMTPQPTATWDSLAPATWDSINGSYSTYGDASKLTLYYTSEAASAYGITSAIRSFEAPGSIYGSGTIDTAATADVNLYVSQFNLSELGANIRGYKVLRTIYPLGRVDQSSSPLMFSIRESDYSNFNSAPITGGMPFDGSTNYQLDFLAAGRYLGMQITYTDVRNFTLSGFDAEFSLTGQR